MAKLILTFNGEVVSERELDQEEITIGRKPDNDIHIDNLAVSGHHARVITILNDSFLEDLKSTNGTFVNGAQIRKHALKDGDHIRIGKHELEYSNEEASADADDDRTVIVSTDKTGMPERKSDDQALKASVERLEADITESGSDVVSKASLRITSGSNAGKELDLSKPLTTLGKPGVQVAAITRRSSGYFIIHVDGDDDRPPTLNGEPVGREPRKIEDQSVIKVAGVQMEFRMHP